MSDRQYGEAPHYTHAFLWTAGVLLFIVLLLLWATFGYPTALLTGLGLNFLIDRLPHSS